MYLVHFRDVPKPCTGKIFIELYNHLHIALINIIAKRRVRYIRAQQDQVPIGVSRDHFTYMTFAMTVFDVYQLIFRVYVPKRHTTNML